MRFLLPCAVRLHLWHLRFRKAQARRRRPNFSPQVGGARLRSRSFSGFENAVPIKPVVKERASENGSRPSRAVSLLSLRDAALATARNIVGVGSGNKDGNASQRSSSASVSSARNGAAPSPLSHSENNTVLPPPQGPASPKVPSSPLRFLPIFGEQQAQAQTQSPQMQSQPQAPQNETAPKQVNNSNRTSGQGVAQSPSPPLQPPVGRASGIRQVASMSALRSDGTGSPLVAAPVAVMQPV